jgi:hypothetical protein
VSGSPTGDDRTAEGARSVSVPLQGFAWESIAQESVRLGVPVEELISFAVLYYLADVDSGRIARRISSSPYPDAATAEDSAAEGPPADA